MTAPTRHYRLRAWLPLAGWFALGLGLRAFRLEYRSLWVDEAYSLNLIQAGFPGILAGCWHDIHPPLYYFLLRLWTLVFGIGLFALRMPSVLCGAAVIPLAFKLTETWSGRRAAWWAAAAVTVSPFLIDSSRWARMPALLLFLTCLSLYLFTRAVKNPGWPWLLGWAAATLAALYTHYFSAFILILEAGYLAGFEPGVLRRSWKRWICGAGLLGAGFIPWLPVLWKHLSAAHPVWRGEALTPLVLVKLPYYFLTFGNWIPETRIIPKLFLGAALVGWGIALWRSRDALRKLFTEHWGWLAGLLAFFPVGALFIYARLRYNLVIPHYLGFSAVAVLILAGAGLSRLRRGWAVAVGVLWLGSFWIPTYNLYFTPYDYPPWRQAANFIRDRAQPGEAAAAYLAAYAQPLDYHLGGRLPVLGVPEDYSAVTNDNVLILDAAQLEPVRARLAAYRGIWLVSGEGDETSARLLRDWLAINFGPQDEQAEWPKVSLRHYRRLTRPTAEAPEPAARTPGSRP